ncbi:MAG: PHP domain-containing protein [Desulfuromonas sp.]|nr:MAG: PHP domain-containing protein [Desulfuromonas sp.]
MIDLHTHTLFSDGELIPAELTRRAATIGYKAIAMTDHGDLSNIDLIIPRLLRVADDLSEQWGLKVIVGIELTHVPPAQFASAAAEARKLGADIVVAHGETIVEPVASGTNRAAIEAGIDILSHPGMISDEDTALAVKNNVCLEITTRKGHSLTNGHVVQMARKHGAKLVVNNDAHAPGDLLSPEMMRQVALGAGMSEDEYKQALANSGKLAGI